jgi:tetrahydromethanopterin S-methyltransferase subunit G
MAIVRTHVTINAIAVMTLLLVGFQSSVFAQGSSSNSINSRIGEAEERINQSLEEAQQRIGEIGDIQIFMDLDIHEILDRFKNIIPFPGSNLGGIPS